MRYSIVDVEHGFYAYGLGDNGNLMMFDCGHKSDPESRPSSNLAGMGVTTIDALLSVITMKTI